MIEVQAGKSIVITKEKSDNNDLFVTLTELGFTVFYYPCIIFKQNLTKKAFLNYLGDIQTYDMIFFTSKNSVSFLMKYLEGETLRINVLRTKIICAVGSKTAQALQTYNLIATIVPQKFTSRDLLNELSTVKGKKILVPQSTRADDSKINVLQEKGAKVVVIPLYKTILVTKKSESFKQLVENNNICCIVFTSPSTVEGFMKRLHALERYTYIFNLPIFCIGPTTAKTAKQNRFKNIYVADVHTLDGIMKKLTQTLKII